MTVCTIFANTDALPWHAHATSSLAVADGRPKGKSATASSQNRREAVIAKVTGMNGWLKWKLPLNLPSRHSSNVSTITIQPCSNKCNLSTAMLLLTSEQGIKHCSTWRVRM